MVDSRRGQDMFQRWISKSRLSEVSWRAPIIVVLVASMLVPLIVGSDFFFPYVVPRNVFFRVMVELAATLLILAFSSGGKTLDLRCEPIFWSLAAFVGAASVSALFSPAATHSFFGDFERMGGVWAWLHLVLFFLLLRSLRDEDWRWVLNGALVVSVVISGTAIAQHTVLASHIGSIDTVVAPSASTLGNSGLLAAYLMMNVAIAGYLATTSRHRRLYVVIGAVNLLGLVFAANRSTIIGLVLGALVGGSIFSTLTTRSRKKLVAPAIAVALALMLAGAAAAIRSHPTSFVSRHAPMVLERIAMTNPAGADESRTLQWRAAIEGFKDRPLLGYGLENHELVWSAHFDPAIYALDTDVYDRTHNQFLEVLATTGIVGTIAFLAIWIAIAVTLARAYRAGRLSAAAIGVLAGLQVAYATYLVFWFVDLNSTMLWIVIAALIASRGTVGSVVLETPRHDMGAVRAQPKLAFASIAALGALLYWGAYTPLSANRALARIDSPRGSLAENLTAFERLSETTAPQTAHTPLIMGEFIASLHPRLGHMRGNPNERRILERAFDQSFAVFAREIHRDTLNDRLYTHQAALLLDAAEFYGQSVYRQQAIDAFHKAIDLSPRRIQPRLGLANMYMSERDYERAIVVLGDAVKVDPMLGEPRYKLAQAYLRAGQSDSALAMLQSSLRLGYAGAPEIYLSMGKRLEFAGRSATAAQLYSDYLEAKYTESIWNRPESIDRPVPSADIAVAAHLPLLYMRDRESELAIKSAAALSAFDPSRAPIVDRFVSDVGSRHRSNWIAKTSLLPCGAVRRDRSRDSTTVAACGVFRRKL
ncbi:MAG: O-antigen ligase family protein [Gemmatimonadaceae bacterium]